MTQPPTHLQRAGRPPWPEIVTSDAEAAAMPADGGRVTIWSFYWSVYVMPDKGDRPVLYTPERIAQMPVAWRR